MNRSKLESGLKAAGITVKGWLPVLECDACKRRWEPFKAVVGANEQQAMGDYWRCPNGCNDGVEVSPELRTATPEYVMINDIPGIIFGAEDLPAFERYVLSMDATEVPNRIMK